MTKIVSAKLRDKLPRRGSSSVAVKRVRAAGGRLVKTFTIDANSAQFGDDLAYVFSQNISEARKENKRLFGSANGIRKK